MEPISQIKKQNLIYNWEVLNSFAPYLSIKDLLSTSTLSKQFNFLLRKYLRHQYSLQSNNNSNQLSQLKSILNRKTYLYNKSTGQIKPHASLCMLKQIQCQDKYSIIQTIDNQNFLVQTQKIINGQDYKLIKFPHSFKNIKGAEGFGIYAYDKQFIYRYPFTPDQQVFTNPEMLSLKIQIHDIVCSQRYALAVVNETPVQISLYIFDNYEPLNAFKKAQLPFNLYNLNIKGNLVLSKFACYLIYNEELYEINLKSGETKKFEQFQRKKILKIIGGRYHFIAFERLLELSVNWGTKQVVQFAQKQGLEDYIKIFKSEKVTGKSLLEMDKKYMEQVLGILNVKQQQKLMLRLEQCNKENPDNYIIHGWGNSSQGELGIISNKQIVKPIKLKLPTECEIFDCSGNHTLIKHKKNGQLLINSYDSTNKKIDWKQVTNKKIWSICSYKDNIVLIAAATKEKVPQRESEKVQSQKKEKLRTAKNIIDKITWDPNINREDFKVGYTDKYDGLLQLPFLELQQSQIKQYRIQYFKRNNQIVWHKKNRIDIL